MDLMNRFVESKGEPIEFEGRRLHWTYHLPVKSEKIRLRFRHFVREPLQGLAINANGCTVKIGSFRSRRFQLWSDSAPESVTIIVETASPGATLSLFNIWGDETHEPMLYRLNNAAIFAQELNGHTVLSCSDGVGPPNFEDLVVVLERVSENSV